ncbi:MAG TPA: DUF1080 domain-containing protein [Luteolibacter sp.]|nr:DUF1080 domain-containing protein [Luteolibacter sp.]
MSTKLMHALLLGGLTCGLALAEENWTPLFNGKDLEGWVKRGGEASYKVENGEVVGIATADTPNTFLCTPRDYADFILEYDFKVDPRLNSGVQIRSQSFDQPTKILWEDVVKEVPAARVHGYQVEIDPSDRGWAVGLFEEAARGWLYPGMCGGDKNAFTQQGKKLFKANDWNHVRVEAKGDHIKTFLNGELRAEIHDSRVQSGFIGLQVHSIGKNKDMAGAEVRWRNIRIQDLGGLPNTLSEAEKAAGWRLLWDGKTTEGWRSARSNEFPKGGWEVKDGMLIIHEGGGGESAAAGDIITKEKFSDFELVVDFKMTPGANSGIKYFVDPELNKGPGSSIGPEFQILDDKRHPDAKLGKDGNRTIGSLYDLITAAADKKPNPVGGWNRARILSRGNKVTYWLNGGKTVEFERGTEEWRTLVAGSKYKKWPNFGELKEGHILLQDHGNLVFFQNIKIRTKFD